MDQFSSFRPQGGIILGSVLVMFADVCGYIKTIRRSIMQAIMIVNR